MVEDIDLEILEPADCRSLLATAAVGRVVFIDMALPTAHPVTFLVDGNGVIFQARDGSELAAAVHDRVVGFEVDDVDLDGQCGWSVTVFGHSDTVTDTKEVDHLSILPLHQWGPSKRLHFVRIQIEVIHGWRLRTASAPAAAG